MLDLALHADPASIRTLWVQHPATIVPWAHTMPRPGRQQTKIVPTAKPASSQGAQRHRALIVDRGSSLGALQLLVKIAEWVNTLSHFLETMPRISVALVATIPTLRLVQAPRAIAPATVDLGDLRWGSTMIL